MKQLGRRIWRWFWRWSSSKWIVLIVLMLLLRMGWGWWVHRELERNLTEVRRAGHSVSLQEVVITPVPEDQNAWMWQVKASRALVNEGMDSPRNSALDGPNYPPYSQKWMNLSETSEQSNAASFKLARRARQFTQVQTRTKLELKSSFYVDEVNPVNWLTNVIVDGAQLKQTKGEDAEAIDRLLDVLHIARSLRQDPFVLAHLMAMGDDLKVCQATRMMGPEFAPERFREGSIARKKVRELMDQLAQEEELRHKLASAIESELVWWMEACRSMGEQSWVLRPLSERDISRMLFNFDVYQEAALAHSEPEAQEVLKKSHWEEMEGPDVMAVMTQRAFGSKAKNDVRMPRYSRWFYWRSTDLKTMPNGEFRTLAERRLTVLSLACQLYRMDHGKWPGQLDELVPSYLKAIPLDPFRADGGRIGYVVIKGVGSGGADRPLLYYEEGHDTQPPKERTYEWMSGWKTVRQYRDLSHFNPASTKAVNNNPR